MLCADIQARLSVGLCNYDHQKNVISFNIFLVIVAKVVLKLKVSVRCGALAADLTYAENNKVSMLFEALATAFLGPPLTGVWGELRS